MEIFHKIKRDRAKNITFYLPVKLKGEHFDVYEQNFDKRELPPITIKGYVSDLGGMRRTLMEYGLREYNTLKILAHSRYKKYFELASKIIVDSREYQTFRDAVGNNCVITESPNNMISVILRGV